jgi:hypothetical protein
MTSYKIENFFGHLDHAQTIEAVEHGASLLTIAELADAVTDGMTAAELTVLASEVVKLLAELDVEDAA